ncbi:hypothetical protein K502DRAFT_329198 [Neoconidiobolus thromboides FSU 785]|nr:hypothetical protein K502DRAFT_329198 [Neoconidiobolus thromboides FSU 785]
MDISKSKMKQLDVINGMEMEEEEGSNFEKGKGKVGMNRNIKSIRTLKLVLSDGIHELYALEYKPIKAISTDTLLGAKILLKEVVVQRGCLMLKPENFTLLGGWVEEFNQISLKGRLEMELRKIVEDRLKKSGEQGNDFSRNQRKVNVNKNHQFNTSGDSLQNIIINRQAVNNSRNGQQICNDNNHHQQKNHFQGDRKNQMNNQILIANNSNNIDLSLSSDDLDPEFFDKLDQEYKAKKQGEKRSKSNLIINAPLKSIDIDESDIRIIDNNNGIKNNNVNKNQAMDESSILLISSDDSDVFIPNSIIKCGSQPEFIKKPKIAVDLTKNDLPIVQMNPTKNEIIEIRDSIIDNNNNNNSLNQLNKNNSNLSNNTSSLQDTSSTVRMELNSNSINNSKENSLLNNTPSIINIDINNNSNLLPRIPSTIRIELDSDEDFDIDNSILDQLDPIIKK